MRELPTGTVTFLFSDIEGSTRLLQAAGEDYPKLLARHAELVREAVASCDGTEVSTEGDSFFLVFGSPAAAVDAAAAIQRALHAEPWPPGREISIRIGLHTGEGVLGGDNYAGIDVNRAARVTGAAHGAQVLMSGATRGLIAHRLPPGVSLRELGSHRLKDLQRPEELYQLVIEGLPSDFPPPRTLDARPNNLPAPPTRFIARPDVEAGIREALADARLLTLTGPGGTGKTRLAIAVATEVLLEFPDGASFADLSPLTDGALVAPTIRDALGVPEDPSRPASEYLGQALADRELLLVLDNFEQVTEGADVVASILQAAPRVKVLATSRVPLHVYGEREFPVPPLVLPDPDHLPDAEKTSQYESVALFIDRATAVKPDFRVTNENAPAVAEICYRLDGLPLAIELAASRIKLLSPDAMLPRLQHRLQLASAGARDLPERQRTLRGAIEWSHDLLDDADRRLFARMSAFMGGAPLDAVERVANADGVLETDLLDELASLVDKSLIRQVEAEGEPRFVMLETIREYALERLEDGGESGAIRRAHAEWVAALAEEAEPHLTGERQLEWLARCDREHDNVRAALRWSLDAGEPEPALRITGALWRFWQQHGHLREGLRWASEVAEATDERTELRAKALTSAGGLAYWMNDYAAARIHYEAALAIREELGAPGPLAEAHYNLAYLHLVEGDHPKVIESLETTVRLASEAGDDLLEANASAVLGYEDAITTRNFDEAIRRTERAVEIFRRLNRRFELADGLTGLAQIYQGAGRLDDARAASAEALGMLMESGNLSGVEAVVYAMAAQAIDREDHVRAVRLMGADAALRERIGGGAPPEILNQLVGDPLELGRAGLAPEVADAAYAEGLAMSVEQAAAYALDEGPDGG